MKSVVLITIVVSNPTNTSVLISENEPNESQLISIIQDFAQSCGVRGEASYKKTIPMAENHNLYEYAIAAEKVMVEMVHKDVMRFREED